MDIQVTIDTGGRAVNVAQADFTYPSRLTFLGFDDTGSAFDITAQETAAGGIVQIARGKVGSVSGTALVTTVRFSAGSSGTASLCPADTSGITDAQTSAATALAGATTLLHIGGRSSFDLACLHRNYIAAGASNRTITVIGHGLATSSSATLIASGTGITFTSITVESTTKMTAVVSVNASAASGYRNVTVFNGPKSFTCKSCLKVGDGPIVQSASPSAVARGATNMTITVTGQHFGPATTVTVARAQVVSATWVNYQRIDIVINVPSTATTGAASIRLYDTYNPSFGYYGAGRCGSCLAIT